MNEKEMKIKNKNETKIPVVSSIIVSKASEQLSAAVLDEINLQDPPNASDLIISNIKDSLSGTSNGSKE